MRHWGVVVLMLGPAFAAFAQDLEPRAYSVSPTGTNFVVIGYGYSSGSLLFDPSLPIANASAQINTVSAGYFRSISLLGRSANFTVAAPYSWGNLQGDYFDQHLQAYRSGLRDPVARLAINLYGAPAMDLVDFASYRQRTNIGFSLTVAAPTGQYDPAKLVNIGTNKWSYRPEIGLSRALGRSRRLILDVYFGVWLFSTNNEFVGKTRTQDPMYNTQFHLSYNIRRRLWAAFDANFYRGGETSVNGVPRNDRQSNSRVGGTIAVPVTRRQSLKFAYSSGAYVTLGGAFRQVSAAYQYMWGGGL